MLNGARNQFQKNPTYTLLLTNNMAGNNMILEKHHDVLSSPPLYFDHSFAFLLALTANTRKTPIYLCKLGAMSQHCWQ
jgi:hypothetical protein